MAFKEIEVESESPVNIARLALLTSIGLEQGQDQSGGIEGQAENRAWAETADLAKKVKGEVDTKLAEEYGKAPDLELLTDFEINAVRVNIVESMSAQRVRAQGVENKVAEFKKRKEKVIKVANPWENGYTIDCGDEIGARGFFYPPFNKTYMIDTASDKPGVSAIEVLGGGKS